MLLFVKALLPALPCRECKAEENWTCITFYPELQRFGMDDLEEETVELMRKRVYDMAGILGRTVKVRRHSTGAEGSWTHWAGHLLDCPQLHTGACYHRLQFFARVITARARV